MLSSILVACWCLVAVSQAHQNAGGHNAFNNPPPVQQHQQHTGQQHGGAQPTQKQFQDPMMSNINKDHVLEHLDGVINKPKEQMTLEEQNFYYFKLHDYDNNNMLDGLELVSAFAHNEEHKDESHAHQETTPSPDQKGHPHMRISDDELVKLIDEIMVQEDRNSDGYITYQEFLLAIKGH